MHIYGIIYINICIWYIYMINYNRACVKFSTAIEWSIWISPCLQSICMYKNCTLKDILTFSVMEGDRGHISCIFTAPLWPYHCQDSFCMILNVCVWIWLYKTKLYKYTHSLAQAFTIKLGRLFPICVAATTAVTTFVAFSKMELRAD